MERIAQRAAVGRNAEYNNAAQPLMQLSLRRPFGEASMLMSLGTKVCRGNPSIDARIMGVRIGGMWASVAISTALSTVIAYRVLIRQD